MLGLRKVKSIIYQTECSSLVPDGSKCSQPIPTKGENGLIDHYFVYSADWEENSVTAPRVLFGIDSERKEVVYIDQSPKIEPGHYPNSFDADGKELYCLYPRFEKLYSVVRAWAYEPGATDHAEEIREYCQLLKRLSGSAVWGFYQELYPEFFQWAESL